MADEKQSMESPPAYSTSQYPPGTNPPQQQAGYPPQQAGYPPQQAGYNAPVPQSYTLPASLPQGHAPPPQGYAPPPQGYAPPPQGYAPPPQGYAPPPQPQMISQQSSTNVVVVGGQQPGQTVIIEKKGVNHCMHCCISIFFPPWIIVWIILCLTD